MTDYDTIDRKTSKYHVSYQPNGPIVIRKITPEVCVFSNHNAQTDFLDRIQGRNLSDYFLDLECECLIVKQGSDIMK